MDEKIINYFLLCAVVGKTPHIMDQLTQTDLNNLMKGSEREKYLRTIGNKLLPRETIIGGNGSNNTTNTTKIIILS